MGQFGNQPDFGTIAADVNISGNTIDNLKPEYSFKPAALYIGTGGTLVCRIVGGNKNYSINGNPDTGYTVFTNVPSGSFLPIIVDHIWATIGDDPGTTCTDIVLLY